MSSSVQLSMRFQRLFMGELLAQPMAFAIISTSYLIALERRGV